MRFHQPGRESGRRQGRPGFNRMLCRCRAALAAVALFLVLVSSQGAGFLVHALQLPAVDTDGCFLGLISSGGKPADNPDKGLTVLRGSPAPDSRKAHDCSTCVICRQFLSSSKIYGASCPVLFAHSSIGREHSFPLIDRYPSREIAPRNGRAPPLTDLI